MSVELQCELDTAILSHAAGQSGLRAYLMPRVPTNMTERFVERARAEGIALRSPVRFVPRWEPVPILRWSAAVALVLIVVFFGARYFFPNQGQAGNPQPTPQPTVAHIDSTSQRSSLANSNSSSRNLQEVSLLQAQLSSAENEIDKLEQQVVTLREELAAANMQKDDAGVRLASLESMNSNLSRDASAKDAQIADLNRQLSQKDSLTTEQLARVLEKQAELEKLKIELTARQNELNQEHQLLNASAQARDLITARNLHIIDVHDNDRAGRQRPFGRIFYTEAQSLIFYAYDLDVAANRNAKLAFHVWGGSLGAEKRALSLGIFRSEDTSAGRWVMNVDDPHVLAQINTVFVTAESAKSNSEQPKGKRILYAFLGERPNHP